MKEASLGREMSSLKRHDALNEPSVKTRVLYLQPKNENDTFWNRIKVVFLREHKIKSGNLEQLQAFGKKKLKLQIISHW